MKYDEMVTQLFFRMNELDEIMSLVQVSAW